MIVVIQSATDRQPHAGHMKTRDGQPVLFVADPKQASGDAGICHARPDALSNFCIPWRKLVQGYNTNPRSNPLGLLPAYQLYADEIYARLVERLGVEKTFILSAGWGLVSASFLTPDYEISLDPAAEPFRRRKSTDIYADFCMLPTDGEEDLYFFGDAQFVPLFCKLTANYPGRRIVFHPAASEPAAPGCQLRAFETDGQAGWYRACAEAFLSAPPESRAEESSDAEAAGPRVSSIEKRLRALRKLKGTTSPLAVGGSEPSARAVRFAIRAADRRLAAYRRLMQSLHEVDITKDEEFQQRFVAYHGISHRSREWHTVYFRLLEVSKILGAEFADVLDELWQETGRYDPAYASRLVATVDPEKPVWDRFTLTRTGLRAPAYLDSEKLKKAADVYRGIREWYADYLGSPGGQRLLALFDEEAPEYRHLSALKKVEFALQPARTDGGMLEAASRARASISKSA